jgi:Rod binding domain-containing protein
MEISALTPKNLPGLTPMPSHAQTAAIGKISSPEDAKIADSCKQFESILWRSMLEKALQPMMNQETPGADKTGTYNYFLSNTISESVSGGPNGISSLLQAQLLKKPQSV